MSRGERPGSGGAPVERLGTLIETDEHIRQAILTGKMEQAQVAPAPDPAPAIARGAATFRPSARPPVPILTVFDDGRTDGELVRIRAPRFTIGRTEGDLKFPLDGRMSARHVEITHQVVGGLHRWVVTDLGSSHGMYVRVSRIALADRAEILVGNGRYRFEAAQAGPRDETAASLNAMPSSATAGWTEGRSPFRAPALTELIGPEIGNRLLLVKGEYWIGSDPSCEVGRPDDPFCDPRHVRLTSGPRGAWNAEHNRTTNGLWLRMPQIILESMILFQIGEQRFKLKLD